MITTPNPSVIRGSLQCAFVDIAVATVSGVTQRTPGLETLDRVRRRELATFLVACVRRETRGRPTQLESLVGAAPTLCLASAARLHRVSGIVRRSLDGVAGIPASVLDELDAGVSGAAHWHLVTVGLLARVAESFDAQNLDWVVMKGPVLAANYHAHVGDRVYGDLDLLVSRTHFAAAMAELERLGFEPTVRNWPLAKKAMLAEVGMRNGSLHIDLHWHLHYSRFDRRAVSIDPESMLARGRHLQVSGLSVRTFDPVDTLVSVAFHAARSGGHALVWLTDIDRVLVVDQPDFAEVVRRAHQYGCAPAVGLMLDRRRRLLDSPVPTWVVRSLAPPTLRCSGTDPRRGVNASSAPRSPDRRSVPCSELTGQHCGDDDRLTATGRPATRGKDIVARVRRIQRSHREGSLPPSGRPERGAVIRILRAQAPARLESGGNDDTGRHLVTTADPAARMVAGGLVGPQDPCGDRRFDRDHLVGDRRPAPRRTLAARPARRNESVDAAELAPFLVALAALLIVSALSQALAGELRLPLGERVYRRTMDDILDVAVEVELEAYETSEFADQLERARLTAGGQSQAVVFGVVSIVSAFVIAAGIVAVLFGVAPILVPVALVGYVPIVLVTIRNNRARYRLEYELTELQRERAYLEYVLSDRTDTKEVPPRTAWPRRCAGGIRSCGMNVWIV